MDDVMLLWQKQQQFLLRVLAQYEYLDLLLLVAVDQTGNSSFNLRVVPAYVWSGVPGRPDS